MTTAPTDISDANVIDVDGLDADAAEHEATTAALVPVNVSHSALMRPVASLDETVKAFHEYQDLRQELLEPSDFQEAERGKSFVTKSGWRKLSVAMSVSDELVKWEDVEDFHGRVRRSKVTVRAVAPNGRYAEGIGICDYRERCCPKAFDEKCTKGGRHRHCDTECTGFSHFSKPQHDIPSTAHTRAKNRALSDLFGFGEVTAEEVSGGQSRDDDDGLEPAPGEVVAAIVSAMNGIEDKGQRRGTKLAFVNAFGQPHELRKNQIDAAKRLVTSAGGTIPDPVSTPVEPPPARSAGDSTGSEGDGSAGAPHVGDTGTSGPSPKSPVADEGAPAPVEAAGSEPVPAPTTAAEAKTPGPASTAKQRQTIGIRCAHLAAADPPLMLQGDKPEIVAILTGERTTTTTEMTADEANKMISTLAFIESGDLFLTDDGEGGRAIGSQTQRGTDFLGPLVRLEPAT